MAARMWGGMMTRRVRPLVGVSIRQRNAAIPQFEIANPKPQTAARN
jgi:hypothetical protein